MQFIERLLQKNLVSDLSMVISSMWSFFVAAQVHSMKLFCAHFRRRYFRRFATIVKLEMALITNKRNLRIESVSKNYKNLGLSNFSNIFQPFESIQWILNGSNSWKFVSTLWLESNQTNPIRINFHPIFRIFALSNQSNHKFLIPIWLYQLHV